MPNTILLNEIIDSLRNTFPDTSKQIVGRFEVKGGVIDPFPIIGEDQYFYIEGNSVNKGLWKNGELTDLQDETFEGSVTPCLFPRPFLAIAEEIEEFQANEKATIASSESIGTYSVTRITTASGSVGSWKQAFGTRLNAWRKL